ncbi:short-chain fatty acid transporter [Corynebacterium phoceense]|uniref:short-chain fatty acid transporter n=1 Tax=Corynebacterium phoceense TaxID=1686286 RepID=UPI001D2C2659|nr:TIGR00366 family protein [Corynebacterium phoceense]HJG43271.1 TIGR00366 family protein [Corynebacterium phoceense]
MATITAPDAAEKRETPFARAMKPVNRVVGEFTPSSLTFAIILTGVVALLALIFTNSGPTTVVQSWGDGLSGLLSFMTQMALVLLLGSILAGTHAVSRVLKRLASVPKTALQAYLFVFFIGVAAMLFSWGLGLILGALLAKRIAVEFHRRETPISFPMLIASAYSAMVIWHMGYSGSAQLTAATEDSFIAKQLGHTIPLGETLFSWWNLLGIALTVACVATMLFIIAPRHINPSHVIDESHFEALAEAEWHAAPGRTFADRIDSSRIPTLLTGLALVAYLVVHFAHGGSTTLDIVNWLFLALIFLFVRNVHELIELTADAASNVGEILIQFPLYAGIMGIMTGTGLATLLSDSIVAVANPETIGVLGFLSAGIVNFFVPSGGGQLAVQGPILLDAAQSMGADPAVVIMAIAYGDQWTNMIQPFWALPILAVAGLKIRDILGYTTATLIAAGIPLAATMLLVGFVG